MKNKELKCIDLGDFTGKTYIKDGFIFTFCSMIVVLNYIKIHYFNYDLVEFDFYGSHYKLEMKYRLTIQKTIEI